MSGYHSTSILDMRTGERIWASDVMSIEEFVNGLDLPHVDAPLPCVEYGQIRPCTGHARIGACDACQKAGAR